MKNISILMNPLSSIIETLLTDINQICDDENIPYFVAGATAVMATRRML